MFMSLGLGGSSLEAKGGIVGGNVEVGKIDTYRESTTAASPRQRCACDVTMSIHMAGISHQSFKRVRILTMNKKEYVLVRQSPI